MRYTPAMGNPLADVHGSMLNMDLSDFRSLHGFLRAYPSLVRPVVAQMLNDLAFRGRQVIPDTLAGRLIMRNPRFALGRTRVEKAGSAAPLSRMAATLGTIYTRSSHGVTHDGWRSLEAGPTTRDRTIALAARGGVKSAQAKRSARLMPGTSIPSPEDEDQGTRSGNLQALIARAAKGSGAHRVMIPAGYGLTPGLHQVVPGTKRVRGRTVPKLRRLQRTDKAPRTHRWPWMGDVIRTLVRMPKGALWKGACDKVLTKYRATHSG